MLKNNIIPLTISLAISCIFSFLCNTSEVWMALLPFIITVTYAVSSSVCEKEYSAISGALAVFASHFICSNALVMYLIIVSAVAGIVIGQMIKKDMSVMSLTIASAVGVATLYSLYLMVVSRVNGYGSLSELLDGISSIMVSTMSMTGEEGTQMAKIAVRTFRDLFPAIVMISSVTAGYVMVFVSGLIMTLFRIGAKKEIGFSLFRADRITTMIFLLSMAVTIFAGYGIAGIIAENIYIILLYVLQVCGLSLLDWVLKNVKRVSLVLRIIILFFVSIIPISSFILVMAAILDARRNFRGLSE